jgi:long-subunit acyl-CoA synthetase (AMP-forming)
MPVTFTTSGSTGVPKEFVLSDELLAARVNQLSVAKGAVFPTITSLFCDLPTANNSGLLYKLWAAQNKVRFFSSGGGSMASALALFEAENIDGIVCNTGGLMNYAAAGGAHRFRCVLALGTPTSPAQARAIDAGLCATPDALAVSYGASEVGSIATATLAQATSIAGCVGPLCPGVQVELDGDLIRVRTATMIEGYTDPALTAQYFKDGWFAPGDRGRLADGLLVLAGRARAAF